MQAIRSHFRRGFKGARVLALRVGLPLAIVIAGMLTGLGYGLFKTPGYSATSYVLVVSQPDEGPPAAVSFAQAYGRLAALPETLAWASTPLRPADVARARENIQASTSPDTPLVRLTASANTPERAARFANTAADALVRYGNAHQMDTGVRVALMTEAAVPLSPSVPDLPLNVAVGTATGILLAGLVIATGAGTRHRRRQRTPVPAPMPEPPAVSRAPETEAEGVPVHAEAAK
jgi:capsular polysaccharide biosynthesis protein